MYRILIVDDERIERNGIRFLLKKLNMEFDIDEAVNGLDALEKICVRRIMISSSPM